MGGISVDGVAGCQSPAVGPETFVVLGVADTVDTVHKRQVTHLVEVVGAVFILQPDGVEAEKRVLCPEERSGFCALIAQMQLDILHFMRVYNGPVLRPALVIDCCRHAVGRRGGGKDIHDEAFVVTVYGKVHFPTVFRTPVPIEHVLAVLAVEVPVHFAPQLVDAGGEGLLGGRTVDVVLVDGEQRLHDEGCFYQVAAIVFLPEGFHLARIAIPPVWVGTVETVSGFEEGDDFLHSFQPFLAGDIAAVYTGKYSHDAEAASTGRDYVLVVLRIDTVHVDAFACQSAVGLGTFPEVVEGTALYGVHQGIVAQPVFFGGGAFALRETEQQQEQ